MPYTPNPQHRNHQFAMQKSQWQIGVPDEQACYQQSRLQTWTCGRFYWGVHAVGNRAGTLGISPRPDCEDLFVAKFVSDQQDNWHGYPVAPWLSPFDKPSHDVLAAWCEIGYITAAQKSKLHRGKKCVL